MKKQNNEKNSFTTLDETTPLLQPPQNNMRGVEIEDSSALNAFFQSVIEDIQNQKVKCADLKCRDGFIISSKLTGLALGGISTLVAYNLNVDFWNRLIGNNHAIATTLNILGVVPLWALVSKLTSDTFGDIARLTIPTAQEEKKIKEKPQNKAQLYKIPLKIFGSLGAAAGSTGMVYLTHKYYEPSLGYISLFLTIPTFVSLTTTYYWGLDRSAVEFLQSVKEIVGHYQEDHSVLVKKNKLLHVFSRAQEVVRGSEEDIINSLRLQLAKDAKLCEFLKQDKIYKHSATVLENSVRYLGWAIGVVGSWVMQPLTEQATASFLQAYGVTDSIVISSVSKTIGWTSWVVFSALTSFATKNIFEKSFKSISNLTTQKCQLPTLKKCGDSALNFLLLGIATCSSTSRIEIGLRYVPDIKILKPIIIGACAIGKFSLDYWALEKNKNIIKQKFFKIKKESNKKDIILFLEKVKTTIPEMNNTYVDVLYRQIFGNSDENI